MILCSNLNNFICIDWMYQKPLLTKDGPLTGSQRQRGMYLNSGLDVGVDPDWDHKERKWKGNSKPKASPNNDESA